MEHVRCFFCLPLPEPLLRGMQAWIDASRAALPSRADVRWVARSNLHLTLQFCGEIPESTVNRLETRVGEIAARFCDPIRLKIAKLGTFGSPARVLWAGLDGDKARLRDLNAAIRSACAEEGIAPDEKRFSPHLTLARFSTPQAAESMSRLPAWTQEGREWAADRMIFMRSRLTPAGPRYTPLAVYPMNGAR